MSFGHLKLFKDIVQARSVSRGGAQNHMSQSAASQHVQELENRLGVALLDRSTRPFTVTAAGRLYYDLCRDLLRRKEEFDAALDQLKGEVEGTVRVASIYSVGLSEMSHLKEEFSRRYPNAHLEVEYLRPDKVYEMVLSDQVDLGIVSYPEATRQLAVRSWLQEEMVVAASPSHPLARKRVLKPAQLSGQEFVGFDDELPIRRKIDHFLRERGVEVNVTMHFDNIQMVKEAVALGPAISILPARAMRLEVQQGRLVGIPMEAALLRPLGILYRRRKKFNRATQCFLDLLEKQPAREPQPAATVSPPVTA